MYRQLALITIVAAAVGGGALAIGSVTQPTAPATSVRPAIQVAPARVAPTVPTIEIDPFYIPQQMNFP